MIEQINIDWDVMKEFIRNVIFEIFYEVPFEDRVKVIVNAEIKRKLGDQIKIVKSSKDKEIMKTMTSKIINDYIGSNEFYESICDTLVHKLSSKSCYKDNE